MDSKCAREILETDVTSEPLAGPSSLTMGFTTDEKTEFALTLGVIDGACLRQRLEFNKAGALVVFEGWVRNHNDGRQVEALEYEGFDEMCTLEAEKILREVQENFAVHRVLCQHRLGYLSIGETAVWVGVASSHRDEAFKACRYVIDEVKSRLPIWKKEYYHGGDSEWVYCPNCAKSSEHESHGHHHL